jgi:hypothetical protein
MALLDSDFDKDAAISPLVTMCLVRLIESILCTHGKTTRNETKQNLLMMVAARHTPVLRLLRSKCTAVRESVALLMGVMITDSPGSVPELIRTAALAEGVLLHQMRVAIFDPSPGRRFVSRYLVSLWLADHHRAGMSLLKRMVRCLSCPPTPSNDRIFTHFIPSMFSSVTTNPSIFRSPAVFFTT